MTYFHIHFPLKCLKIMRYTIRKKGKYFGMRIIQGGGRLMNPLRNRFEKLPFMTTCKAYVKPNYAKSSWKTYVTNASGSIHQHVATKTFPFVLTFKPGVHRK